MAAVHIYVDFLYYVATRLIELEKIHKYYPTYIANIFFVKNFET